MSLRWLSYVAPKPRVKLHFVWRKSATKVLCLKTVSDIIVRHSFAYLSMYKWLVRDVPFCAKIWRILTHPLQKADFQFCARSASAVSLSKKVVNTKSTTRFSISLRWPSYVVPKPKKEWLKNAVSKIWTITPKLYEIGCQLVLITDGKSHMGFLVVLTSDHDDLEWPWTAY